MELRSAGIYVRVSTERQANEGYSVAAQKENLTKFAKDNNFKVFDVYADEGISGKNIDGRPAVKRLIEDIQNNKIDVVLIQKFDRLTRNITDTEDFIRLFQEYDVDVWSISDGGKVDISNLNGKFMTRLKGLFAQHVRELTSERIKVAFARKAREGYTLCCGSTPYGYNRKKGNKVIVINQEEAKVVRRIFRMFANNMSFTQIAKTLNDEGIPTKKAHQKGCAGVWMPKSVRLILSNPVYIGKVRYGIGRKDYYIGEGKHKPIVTAKVWKHVEEKLSKIKHVSQTKLPKEVVYYCGTLVCGVCGHKLTTNRTVKTKKDGSKVLFPGYRCVNREKGICVAVGMSHKKVEEAFIEYLTNYVAEFNNIEDLFVEEELIDEVLEEIKSTKSIISNAEHKLKQVMEPFMVDKIDQNQLDYMTKELKEKISKYKLILTKLERQHREKPVIDRTKISRHIVDHWQYLTNGEKLAFLTDFVEEIVVVNRDNDKIRGKAEVLSVKFYEYSKNSSED